MNSSRRDFIKTVLLASGAVLTSWDDVSAMAAEVPTDVAMLNFSKAHAFFRDRGARPTFPPSKKKIDVVVIGAGSAGLAAAWRLRQAGRDVLVLENEPSAGGVLRYPAPTWQGITYPLGADHFYEFTGPGFDFFNALRLDPIPTVPDAIYFEKDRIAVDWWRPGAGAAGMLPEGEHEAFGKFAAALRTMNIPAYPLRTVLPAVIREFDSVRALPFVREFKSSVLQEVLNLYSLSTFGVGLDEVNLYAFLNFYARELGVGGQPQKRMTLRGGPGELAARAVKVIGPEAFRTNAAAVNVFNYDDGTVDVNYVDTESGEPFTITARAVMICASKRITRAIVPDLPAPRAVDMHGVRYAPYINIAMCCSAPLFSKRAFTYWLGDRQRIFSDIVDVTASTDALAGIPNRKGGSFVYVMSCPRPEIERPRLQQKPWLAEFAQRGLTALETLVPDARSKVQEMHVFSWGHSHVIPAVGSYQKLLPSIAEPFGRIFFAGADSDLAPSINHAVDSALYTAEQILALKK